MSGIADVIGPDRVIVGLRAGDKTQVLQELAGRASTALGMAVADLVCVGRVQRLREFHNLAP